MRVIQKTELIGIVRGKSRESPKLEQLDRGESLSSRNTLVFWYFFSLFGSDKQHVGF